MATPVYDQSGTALGTGGNSLAISVSTAGINEIVLLAIQVDNTASKTMTSSVSGASLAWTKIVSVPNTATAYQMLDVWFAIAPTALTAAIITATITLTGGGTVDDISLIYAAFSGQNASPLDPNPSLPGVGSNNASSGVSCEATISTSFTDDVVVFALGSAGTSVWDSTPAGGATKIASVQNDEGVHVAHMWMQQQGAPTPFSNVAVGVGNTWLSSQWAAIAITGGASGGSFLNAGMF